MKDAQILPFASLSLHVLSFDITMHQKELHVVRFSMIVLFSALMIVYLLLYQIKGNDIVEQLTLASSNEYEQTKWSITNSTWETTIYDENPLSETLIQNELLADQNNTGKQTWQQTWDNQDWTTKRTTSLFEWEINESTGQKTSNKIIVLSGTSLRYWRVEVAEKLWISYQYALKDAKNIYYVFLDPKKYKLDEIVKSLWWSTYTMTTEKEILENKLFWDKIMFINIPEYKNKKVIILAEVNKDSWLIQIDYEIYHNSKLYIKQLFID